MAITAFTSTAIIDATTVGTTVLTASSEGIAADAIGLGATDNVTFNSVDCGDGSFSGSLVSEVSGSYKLYNLGTEGDADSEYFETSFDTNVLKMFTYTTGTGVRRNLEFGNADNQVNVKGTTDSVVIRTAGTAKMIFGATFTSSQDLTPASNLGNKLGLSTQRWSDIYCDQGRFASLRTAVDTETAATVTMNRATDHTKLCDCTSNNITVNLDAANPGIQYVIKKIDSSSNTVTIDGFGFETIDGATTLAISTQYESVTIVSDGTNWFIV